MNRLRRLIFMALCCDLGIFAKKLIVPAANLITDALHIPGGIGASFSLMFIVVAAALVPRFGCAVLMGAVQSVIALCMGTVGSMGILSPLGYILPGLAIDLVLFIFRRAGCDRTDGLIAANMTASAAACLTANFIVFRLRGIVLMLYLGVSLTSGAVCGVLAAYLAEKLKPMFTEDNCREKKMDRDNTGTCGRDVNTCRGASGDA